MDEVFIYPRPSVPVAIRTLSLAGYIIENNRRQPTHTEIECTAPILGIQIPLLVAITESDEFPEAILDQLRSVASRARRSLVTVSAIGSQNCYSWGDFLEYFGGAVPSWRALGGEYSDQLRATAGNVRPETFIGEVWRLFEQLVADGLEFIFARRVRRLGAVKRGRRVSDMITQIPDGDVLVVDAKATSTSFNAAMHELRPLVEYVRNQQTRQRGSFHVFGALVVAPEFNQDAPGLTAIAREFIADTNVPIAFLKVSELVHFIAVLRVKPQLRPGLRWKRILAGGLVEQKAFDDEVAALEAERY